MHIKAILGINEIKYDMAIVANIQIYNLLSMSSSGACENGFSRRMIMIKTIISIIR